jgi:hypothetical protein
MSGISRALGFDDTMHVFNLGKDMYVAPMER